MLRLTCRPEASNVSIEAEPLATTSTTSVNYNEIQSDTVAAAAGAPASQKVDSQPQPTTSTSTSNSTKHTPYQRKRKSNKAVDADDDALFNSWLQSEIDKNANKTKLMNSKKELIEL